MRFSIVWELHRRGVKSESDKQNLKTNSKRIFKYVSFGDQVEADVEESASHPTSWYYLKQECPKFDIF